MRKGVFCLSKAQYALWNWILLRVRCQFSLRDIMPCPAHCDKWKKADSFKQLQIISLFCGSYTNTQRGLLEQRAWIAARQVEEEKYAPTLLRLPGHYSGATPCRQFVVFSCVLKDISCFIIYRRWLKSGYLLNVTKNAKAKTLLAKILYAHIYRSRAATGGA